MAPFHKTFTKWLLVHKEVRIILLKKKKTLMYHIGRGWKLQVIKTSSCTVQRYRGNRELLRSLWIMELRTKPQGRIMVSSQKVDSSMVVSVLWCSPCLSCGLAFCLHIPCKLHKAGSSTRLWCVLSLGLWIGLQRATAALSADCTGPVYTRLCACVWESSQ